jgi:cytidine deaminase
MTNNELLALACIARENAYAPYSGFWVGAALLSDNGKAYTGCNVENASYSATCCAERVAFGAAIAAGERRFSKIAIVGGKAHTKPTAPCMPCGICRQVMAEFCDESFEIIVTDGKSISSYSLSELLPHSFAKSALGSTEE